MFMFIRQLFFNELIFKLVFLSNEFDGKIENVLHFVACSELRRISSRYR